MTIVCGHLDLAERGRATGACRRFSLATRLRAAMPAALSGGDMAWLMLGEPLPPPAPVVVAAAAATGETYDGRDPYAPLFGRHATLLPAFAALMGHARPSRLQWEAPDLAWTASFAESLRDLALDTTRFVTPRDAAQLAHLSRLQRLESFAQTGQLMAYAVEGQYDRPFLPAHLDALWRPLQTLPALTRISVACMSRDAMRDLARFSALRHLVVAFTGVPAAALRVHYWASQSSRGVAVDLPMLPHLERLEFAGRTATCDSLSLEAVEDLLRRLPRIRVVIGLQLHRSTHVSDVMREQRTLATLAPRGGVCPLLTHLALTGGSVGLRYVTTRFAALAHLTLDSRTVAALDRTVAGGPPIQRPPRLRHLDLVGFRFDPAAVPEPANRPSYALLRPLAGPCAAEQGGAPAPRDDSDGDFRGSGSGEGTRSARGDDACLERVTFRGCMFCELPGGESGVEASGTPLQLELAWSAAEIAFENCSVSATAVAHVCAAAAGAGFGCVRRLRVADCRQLVLPCVPLAVGALVAHFSATLTALEYAGVRIGDYDCECGAKDDDDEDKIRRDRTAAFQQWLVRDICDALDRAPALESLSLCGLTVLDAAGRHSVRGHVAQLAAERVAVGSGSHAAGLRLDE